MIRIIRTKNGNKERYTLIQIILLLVIMLLLVKKILKNESAIQHKFNVLDDDISKPVDLHLAAKIF